MLSPHTTDKLNRNPSKLWWLFAIVTLSVCVMVQLPISWVVHKYLPNSPHLQWVSGNVWQGSANWQAPSQSSDNADINGTLNWQWKPLKLFIGKLSADVHIISGKSRLKGEVNIGMGMKTIEIEELKGSIHQDTLSNIVDWQLPDAPIQVNKLSINFDKETGFENADGQLTWVGGQLGYPNAGKILQINLPAMKANMSNDKKTEGNRLHVHLVNEAEKTLGNFYVDNKGMLDVGLTQRLLENMPDYNGSAPQDTAVVSIRQPLFPSVAEVNKNATPNANKETNQNTHEDFDEGFDEGTN